MSYTPPVILSRRKTKFEAGGFLVPITLEYTDEDRIQFLFGFNRALMDQIKKLEKRKWLGPPVNPDGPKIWDCPITPRNLFRIAYLERHATGIDPYAVYDAPLKEVKTQRPLMSHQFDMAGHGLTRHYGIIAGAPGVGKTLSIIEVMEQAYREGATRWFYVAPKTALPAIERELKRWKAVVRPMLLTYERLVSLMGNWTPGDPAPHGVVFDESSRLKTPTAQRSVAAKALADAIRKEHGPNGYVLLMSGTPAPKSPSDFYWQCEIAQPGFLLEGSLFDFNARLAITRKEEGASGAYNQLLSWKDNPAKCGVCGELADHENHIPDEFGLQSETADGVQIHDWVASENEVAKLYDRMKGLVIVKLKEQCLDLPAKRYDRIYCKPSSAVLRVAKTLVNTAKNTITGLSLLRQLSDGFNYVNKPDGHETCELCNGSGTTTIYRDPEAESGESVSEEAVLAGRVISETGTCTRCNGTCLQPRIVQQTETVECPKDDALRDLLDEYSEIGRVVIYGGFTATVERCTALCIKEGWHVIQVTGAGWRVFTDRGNPIQITDHLTMFQDEQVKYPRVAFVAAADSANMGLTLTASPVIIYYSNSFNAESRLQSEDRIHRPGLDLNLGARIIDLIHLPSDEGVLDNLQKKRELQAMSLGDFWTEHAEEDNPPERE